MLTFQNVSGESVSSAIKVGMVLNRLGDSERASHLVMNAKRPREQYDLKAEVINISRARAVAAGAYTLAVKNNSHPGIQPMDVDVVLRAGACKDRGSETRIRHNNGKPGHVMKDCWSRKQRKAQEGQEQRCGQRQCRSRWFQGSIWDSEHCQPLEMRTTWRPLARRHEHRNLG